MRTSFLRTAFVSSNALRSPATTLDATTGGSVHHRLSSTTTTNTRLSMSSSSAAAAAAAGPWPELLVYDMDACLWDQEMYEMNALPEKTVLGDLNGRGEGVVGVMSGYDKISLHKGSLISLQEHWDNKYPGMRIAMASSADTPFAEKVGRASLKLLEVVPGVTVWDVLMRDWDGVDVNQIGRQPPLSSNKSATHFPILRRKTGIRYDRMLFFDDCNWGDHCLMVAQNCKEEDNGRGPTTVRTPAGLRETEFREGMAKYAANFVE